VTTSLQTKADGGWSFDADAEAGCWVYPEIPLRATVVADLSDACGFGR